MTAMWAAAASAAVIRSTSSNRIITNWKLISTMQKSTYDVDNVLRPYRHRMRALSWTMAMRWHARKKWVFYNVFFNIWKLKKIQKIFECVINIWKGFKTLKAAKNIFPWNNFQATQFFALLVNTLALITLFTHKKKTLEFRSPAIKKN